jgi:hypothetical protein
MAIYPSAKETSKVKKVKKFSKYDLLSAMVVMHDVQNYYKINQDKQEVNSSNDVMKKDKETKGVSKMKENGLIKRTNAKKLNNV